MEITPQKDEPIIEIIARAIIVDKNSEKILFCAPKNESYFYLPGGHIEFGETATIALARELKEETGEEISPSKFSFVGTNENLFTQNEKFHHEINLYFHLDGVFSSEQKIISKEDNIIFLWISISELSHYRILPESIIDMIKKWQEGSNNIWQQ